MAGTWGDDTTKQMPQSPETKKIKIKMDRAKDKERDMQELNIKRLKWLKKEICMHELSKKRPK